MQGFSVLGYKAPAIDVKKHFLDSGFNKDLHFYSCEIYFSTDKVSLIFNTPIPKHTEDRNYISGYKPPIIFDLIKETNNG